MTDTSVHVEFKDVHARRIRTPIVRDRLLSKFSSFSAALAVAEAVSIVFAAAVAKLLYINFFSEQMQGIGPYLAPAPLLAVAFYLFLKRDNLYDPIALGQPVVAYGRILGALAASFLILLGILYILKFADWYSRGWFLTWFCLSGVSLITVRLVGMQLVRRMVANGRLRQRIALFGTIDFINAMRSQIESAGHVGAVEGTYLATVSGAPSENAAFDGGINDLKNAIESKRYDTILIGLPATEIAQIKSAVNDLAAYSTELLLCTHLDREPLVVRGGRNIGTLRTEIVNVVPLSENNRLLKAGVDYIIAAISLLLLSPLLLLIAAAIKLDSPGPVFFRQRRYGQNNRIFRIFKFRTMSVAEDDHHVKQAERNDPRVTRIGWLLRRSSLDELPQLINVLIGDMSIVGPRPHALAHDRQFEQQLDSFSLRRRVRPGLTGWAQVHGFRGETKTSWDICARVEHDLYYIDNWSIWLDFEIMIRTIFVLFRGAY